MDYIITILPLVFFFVGLFGVYLIFRLLMALIIYYERLNREARNR
ncbi:MAG TPA: hypothetical protein VEA37_14565 [Flavobacterium sp.]|nr:hypothetical protein [Flavobacterium sp.]